MQPEIHSNLVAEHHPSAREAATIANEQVRGSVLAVLLGGLDWAGKSFA